MVGFGYQDSKRKPATPIYDGGLFTFVCKDAATEASTLGLSVGKYPRRFGIRSHRTGRVLYFSYTGGNEHVVEYSNIDNPHAPTTLVRIYND